MKRPKNETLSIRTSTEVKQVLRMAAKREHRSIASMVEVLILAYAERHGLNADGALDGNAGEVESTDGTH